MRKLLLSAVLCLAFVGICFAQGGSTQVGTGFTPSGSTLPTTCSPANTTDANAQALFYKTTATIGLYQCTATNTWTAVGSGSSIALPATVTGAVSGGVECNTSTTTMTSSVLLTANLPVIGGGAGACPTVGTRTGNTTQFSTWTGATTSTRCVDTDANGNLQITATDCPTTGLAPVTNTTPVTASNPTGATDTILMALSLPANYLNTVGTPFYIHGSGTLNTTAASVPQVTITAKVCSVAGCGSGTVTPLAAIQSTALNTTAVTNAGWNYDLVATVVANGASCNLIVKGAPGLAIETGNATTVADSVFAENNTGVSSPNQTCTNALFLDFFVQQSTTGASNSYTQTEGVIAPFASAPPNQVAGASGAIQFNAGAVFTGTVATLKCNSGMAGADWGAKANTCLAATTGVADMSELKGSQTLGTAITIPANKTLYCGAGTNLSQTAAVTASGAKSSFIGDPSLTCIITKAGNLDQITVTAANVTVQNLNLAGVKGSFTGHGINLNTGATNDTIQGNIISAEAGDNIIDQSGTFNVNLIQSNFILSWGAHGMESTSASPQSTFSNNYMLGDGAGTGAGLLNTGSMTVVSNYIKDSNATQTLFDDSGASQNHPVTSNRVSSTGAAIAFKGGAHTVATSNTFSGTGGTGPVVSPGNGGTYTGNSIVGTNEDGIDVGSDSSLTFAGNIIALTVTTSTSRFGISFNGDQIANHTVGNQISIADTANAGNTDACIQNNPLSGHNLNMLFEGDSCLGINSGSITMYGFFLNNSNNLNTNWSQTVRDLTCVHITTCLKRTDTQNNISVYESIQQGDVTLDAGTGSTADKLLFDNSNFTFATLPTPAGNGSRLYCTDCTQAKPTAAAGSGAFVVREAGAWNGL